MGSQSLVKNDQRVKGGGSLGMDSVDRRHGSTVLNLSRRSKWKRSAGDHRSKYEMDRRRFESGRRRTITKVSMARMGGHVNILDSTSRSYL